MKDNTNRAPNERNLAGNIRFLGTAINTLLLDMDGTILDLNYDNYFWGELLPARYAHAQNLALPQAKKLLAAKLQPVAGTQLWYDIDYWSAALQLDLLQLKQSIAADIKLLPHALNFIHSAKQHGLRLFLISNAHPASIELKLSKLKLADYFAAHISAFEFGYCKEQREFWQALASKINFDNDHTIFVDDNHQVLNSAAMAGLSKLVCIDRPDSARPANSARLAVAYHVANLQQLANAINMPLIVNKG